MPIGDTSHQTMVLLRSAMKACSVRRTWLQVFGLFVIVFLAYQPTWRAGFIWDDDAHLTKNVAVLSPNGLERIWSSLQYSHYYPLTLTTFWVEHRLWELRPLPYHLVNVALHAANAILLWIFLRRLGVPGAWTAAALWAVHSVNVETAAWVTELKNTQSGFFFLLALVLYLRFEDYLSTRDYWLALASGAAGMASKPSTVVLPAIILLLAWWRRGRWNLVDLLRVAPLVVLAASMSLLTVIEQRHHIAVDPNAEWTFTIPQRLMVATRAPWFYASSILWPFQLCFVYPRWELKTDTPTAWIPLAALLAAAGLLWWFRTRRRVRATIFGVGCFVVALLPVLGFFDIYYFQYSFVADHFQYLASAAIIALLTAAVAPCVEAMPHPWLTTVRSIGVVVLTILMALTYRQTQTYTSSEQLFRSTIARNPGCWMAHGNLGNILFYQGRLAEASDQYQQALRIHPNDAQAQNNLGVISLQSGKIDGAIDQFQWALRISPDFAEAHNNLGNVLTQAGRIPEAIEHLELALQIKPNYPEAHYNLAVALKRASQVPMAIEHYMQALQLKPDYSEAYNGLGIALAQTGRAKGAIEAFEKAVHLRPDYAEAQCNLGVALGQAGRIPEGIAHLEKALRLKPDYPEAHYNLGIALEQAGRIPEAIQQYEDAVKLRPDLLGAQNALRRLRGRQ